MKHVLIAVSDFLLADGIGKFTRLRHLGCELAHDVIEANRHLQSKQFEIVVIDIDLPNSGGLEVLRFLRRSGNAVPVILLSFQANSKEWGRVFALGANILLRKPFKIDDLMTHIQSLLEREKLIPERLQCGNLVLDERTKLVSANGKEFTVSPREWAILKFMVCHAGKVVSKQQLIESVFSSETTHAPNTIEVQMSRIRPKLAGTNAHIRTIRGYGYLMEIIAGCEPSPSLQPIVKQTPIP